MCTAIFDNKFGAYFGRTLDLECSFGEKVTRVSRGETLRFLHAGATTCKYAIIGMAHPTATQPLFYDALNDRGLCAAALNFPMFAFYHEKIDSALPLASFEVISYILSQCACVTDAISALDRALISDDDFSPSLKSRSLHWMIADKERAIVVESVKDGLKIYENPFGVMTNSPPFPYHTARLCEYSNLSPYQIENRLAPTIDLTPYSRGLGAFGLPGDFSSSSRFIRAFFAKESTLLPPWESIDTKNKAMQRIFDILSTVSLPFGIARTAGGEPIYTVYTSLIDIERREYRYFTYADRNIKSFTF